MAEREVVHVMFPDGSGGPVPRSRLASALKLGAREVPQDSIKTALQPDTPQSQQAAAQRVGRSALPVAGRMVREALPMLGAMGASMAVPPAAPLAWMARTAAAGAGGTGGGLAQQYAGGQRLNPLAALRTGGEQAMLQVGGEGLGKAFSVAARPLMSNAMRPTSAMLRRSPTLVEDALRLRVPVRSPGEAPLEAIAARSGSARQASRMVARADRTGVRVQYPEMSRRLGELREEFAKTGATDDKLAALDEFVDAFKAKWGGGASAAAAQGLKRGAQREATQVFKAERAGGMASDVQNVRARAQAAVAKDVREALGRKVPGLHGQNRETQKAMELAKAMERAATIAPSRLDNVLRAGVGAGAGFAAGGGDAMLTGAGAFALPYLSSPHNISRAALLFRDPAFQQMLRSTPRAALFAARDATDAAR